MLTEKILKLLENFRYFYMSTPSTAIAQDSSNLETVK